MGEEGKEGVVSVCGIFIGSTGVGKTCLSRRFKDGEWANWGVTSGVDAVRRTVEVHGARVVVKLWDASGQETFASILSTYLRTVDFCVVVYDCTRRETFERAPKWLADAHEHGAAGLPLVVAANKCDLEDQRAVHCAEGAQLARHHGAVFVECSAKTKANVDVVVLGAVERALERRYRALAATNAPTPTKGRPGPRRPGTPRALPEDSGHGDVLRRVEERREARRALTPTVRGSTCFLATGLQVAIRCIEVGGGGTTWYVLSIAGPTGVEWTRRVRYRQCLGLYHTIRGECQGIRFPPKLLVHSDEQLALRKAGLEVFLQELVARPLHPASVQVLRRFLECPSGAFDDACVRTDGLRLLAQSPPPSPLLCPSAAAFFQGVEGLEIVEWGWERGSTGVVHRARYTNKCRHMSDVAVAVKTPQERVKGIRHLYEFENETMRQLRHDNILEIVLGNTSPECPFPHIVTPLVTLPGTDNQSATLARVLARGLTARMQSVDRRLWKLRALQEIANAILYMHSICSVMHLDVCAANVLVTCWDLEGDCLVKLFDFGSARPFGVSCQPHTTLTHAAPELIEGGSASPEMDVYAWGMLCAETLLEGACFSNHPSLSGHPTEFGKAVVAGTRPPLAAVQAMYPPELLQLVRLAWHGTSAERPSMGDVCAAMDRIVADFDRQRALNSDPEHVVGVHDAAEAGEWAKEEMGVSGARADGVRHHVGEPMGETPQFRCMHDGLVTGYDCFISYRQSTTFDVAEKLFLALHSAATVFLDKRCLVWGANWQQGFVRALKHSRTILLLLSRKSLEGMRHAHLAPDNLLLEFELALERDDHGEARVLPMVVGEYAHVPEHGRVLKKFDAFDVSDFPQELHCHAESPRREGVRSTLQRLFRHQVFDVDPDNVTDAAARVLRMLRL